MRIAFFAAFIYVSSACAEEVFLFSPDAFSGAEIVIVGEIHDDEEHHRLQAGIVEMLSPKAVVFEMLTAEQAERVTADNKGDVNLGEVLGWEQAGWPDFAMYSPIFVADIDAEVVGAAPSEIETQLAKDDIISAFGVDAGDYGLTKSLPIDEQTEREAGMQDGHCGALPPDILPWFVDQQRFRDAVFARSALQALQRLGAPIVVITGNGHARNDWGMPVYLAAAAPDVDVVTIGQLSTPGPNPPFDLWRLTDPVDRPDPCAAFE